MPSQVRTISILLSTRNRSVELRATLDTLALTQIPENTFVELIAVDNGSIDDSFEVLQYAEKRFSNHIRTTVLSEPNPGKARALERARHRARGEVLVFVDDDVRVPLDWLGPLTNSIFAGEVDAVAGGIRLAADLHREWMCGEHFDYLACTAHKRERPEHPTVGANCAIARTVVERMGGFDPEIGPGAIGHAEDLFLWLKMRASGCRLGVAFEVEVEHHPSAERLTRGAFLQMAEKNGDWLAYVDYHWQHTTRRMPRMSLAKAYCKLWAGRARHPIEWWTHPAAPDWELPLLVYVRFRQQYLVERRSPRKYDREGPVKRSGELL